MTGFVLHNIHTSVLLEESKKILDISSRKKYIDCTLGLGGHTFSFLKENSQLCVKGFDHDISAREKAKERLEQFIEEGRMEIIPKNFENIQEQENFFPDSIFFDIGVSSLQFDTPDRGFSFRFEAPLDMRMNTDDFLTAEIIVNTWSEEKLEKIFLEYGEESWGKHIAKKICEDREKTPFKTTTQLAEFIARIKPFEKDREKNSGGHPAVLVFQALRIAVNRELEVLEKALHAAIKILAPEGRIAVITFHSLEDKIVKNIFAFYEQKGKKQKYPKKEEEKKNSSRENISFFLEKINKKPIIPSSEEVLKNPRSRSAKLRGIIKHSF